MSELPECIEGSKTGAGWTSVETGLNVVGWIEPGMIIRALQETRPTTSLPVSGRWEYEFRTPTFYNGIRNCVFPIKDSRQRRTGHPE